MFPVYVVTCLQPQAVHNWVKKRGERFAVDEDVETGGAGMAETTVKRLPCYWYRRTGKEMGQLCQCWWRIC
jgi:hypothetical protein